MAVAAGKVPEARGAAAVAAVVSADRLPVSHPLRLFLLPSSAAVEGVMDEDVVDGAGAPDRPPGGASPAESDLPWRVATLRRCTPALPIVLPQDLQTALAAATLGEDDSPSRPRRRQRKRARLNPPTGGTCAAPRRRARVSGGGESSSSSPSTPDPPPSATEASDVDDATAGVTEDELDMRQRVLDSIAMYKRVILRDLAAVLRGQARTTFFGGALRVTCVAEGAAVVVSEGERACVTWCTRAHGSAIFLCTCGGRLGAESIEVRSFVGSSSTCAHARALHASFSELAQAVGVVSIIGLLERHAALDNSAAEPSTACVVHLATKTASKMAVFAVLDGGAWAAVTVRRRLGKKKTPKRTMLRAACTQLSCAKIHWWCPHVAAVSAWSAELRQAMALAAGLGSGLLPEGLQDVRLPASAPARARLTPVQQAAADAAFSDEKRWRNSRNLLPCSGEIADCLLFDQLASMAREAGERAVLPEVLCEQACFQCGSLYNGLNVKNTGATLHTLQGRVAVSLRQWTCGCGKDVLYDGAHSSLFASTTRTVFTRTFMDVMIQMVFTGHSTLSSSTSVMCFLLECTDSLSGAPAGLARQTLTAAVHRFARTLIVPAELYRCKKCKQAGDCPYLAIVVDGEVLSILRNLSQPLVRVTDDVRVVPLDIKHGCCVPVAAIRGAVRKRLSADRGAVVRLTKGENSALARLGQELVSVPDPHVVGEERTSARAVRWAAAFLFFSFYTNEEGDCLPDVEGTDADDDNGNGGEGNDLGGNDGPDGGGDGGAAAALGHVGGDMVIAAAAVDDGSGAVQGGVQQPPADANLVVAPAASAVFFSRQVTGAFHGQGNEGRPADNWRSVRQFLTTFVAEPVLGVFAGLRVDRIELLAKQLVLGKPVSVWRPFAKAVESVGMVWPFLRLIGSADDVDPLMTRAIGELLLFSCSVDKTWETLWRQQAPDPSTAFETQWKVTSIEKYRAWRSTRPDPAPPSSQLLSSVYSYERATAQALEVRSGHVWPDLAAVRTFMTDGKSDAVSAARAAKVGANRDALQDLLSRELGADDCRHAFLDSQAFMPGIENFLCPCGMLIGYDFLDRAESPAHVLASLVQRFPVLPSVVYFDTACQLARNASRRIPWLVSRSGTAFSVDRAHHQKNQHKCSPVFDADAYPSRSVRHRTACAESRHSLNKAYKTHLVHLRQDHFIVQMRLLGAMINLRVMMRKALGKETNHRLMCAFFHARVQSYCDRRDCSCFHGERQAADRAAAAGDAAAANLDDDVIRAGGNDAAVAAGAGGTAGAAGGEHAAADAAAGAVDADAAGVARMNHAAAAPGHVGPVQLGALHLVQDAVADAVVVAAQAAVDDAAQAAIEPIGYAVGLAVGVAVGQAAVEGAYAAAGDAAAPFGAVGARSADDVRCAAQTAAARSVSCVDVQRSVHAAVQAAVQAALVNAARSAGRAAAATAGHQAGVAAGLAAALAVANAPQPAGVIEGGGVGVGDGGGMPAGGGAGGGEAQEQDTADAQGGGPPPIQGGGDGAGHVHGAAALGDDADVADVIFGQASVQDALRAAMRSYYGRGTVRASDSGNGVSGEAIGDGGDLDGGRGVFDGEDLTGGVGEQRGAGGLGATKRGRESADEAASSVENFSSSSDEEAAPGEVVDVVRE